MLPPTRVYSQYHRLLSPHHQSVDCQNTVCTLQFMALLACPLQLPTPVRLTPVVELCALLERPRRTEKEEEEEGKRAVNRASLLTLRGRG